MILLESKERGEGGRQKVDEEEVEAMKCTDGPFNPLSSHKYHINTCKIYYIICSVISHRQRTKGIALALDVVSGEEGVPVLALLRHGKNEQIEIIKIMFDGGRYLGSSLRRTVGLC